MIEHAFLDPVLLPVFRKLDIEAPAPPDVVPGGIDDFELEVIGRRFRARIKREGGVFGQRDGDFLAHGDVTHTAPKIEIEPHAHAGPTGILGQLRVRTFRGYRRPTAQGFEVVQYHSRGTRRPSRPEPQ